MTAGYSGTPLPRKLGIAAGARVLQVGGPDLGLPVPPRTRARAGTTYDVVMAFCPDLRALERHCERLPAMLEPRGALWLCWPKRASGVVTDVTESLVHQRGLATGLVDVKVAAIDDTWSGLQFRHRRQAR
jgi:hypothetical protein